MASDIFGGLGNMFGELAKNVVPKDTPEGKLLNAQSNLTSLKKQEEELLVEIGREAYKVNPSQWPQDAKLKLIQQNLADAQSQVEEAKIAQKDAEVAKEFEANKGVCQTCGFKNPDGIKFCQECGSSLELTATKKCVSCAIELESNVRFCGACGAKQE